MFLSRIMNRKMRRAYLSEYIEWLDGYMRNGGMPNNYYGYPFPYKEFVTATRDFHLGCERGALAFSIIIPAGIHHTSGDIGHNNLYYMDGFRHIGNDIPVYSNAAFTKKLPGDIKKFIADERERERLLEDEYMDDERKAIRMARSSDLARFNRQTGRI